MRMDRREFLTLAAALASSTLVEAQTTPPPPTWGGPVIDTHLHLRDGLDASTSTCRAAG